MSATIEPEPKPLPRSSPLMRDYLALDAVGLAEAIRGGDLSKEEARQAAVERMEAAEAQLRFLAHRFESVPSEHAKDAPFAGVPFLLKDDLELEGHPITIGTKLMEGQLPERTHPVLRDMLAAGLEPLGRTTMSELGFLPTTEPLTQAPTLNPWNRDYSPGGSSGGSAAAVAAGVVPAAHGADGGGSIRIPASCCGLVGLKPSRGRHASSPYDPPLGFVSQHVLSRTVRDSAALLDALSNPTPGYFCVPQPEVPFADQIKSDPAPLRIGVTLHGLYGETLDPEVEQAMQHSLRILGGMGHHIDYVKPPFITEDLAPAFTVVWAAGAGVTTRLGSRIMEKTSRSPLIRALARRRSGLRALMYLPDRRGRRVQRFTQQLMARDSVLTPSDLWLADRVFGEIRADFDQYYQSGFDLWITPTLIRPPAKVGEIDMDPMIPPTWRLMASKQSVKARRGLPLASNDDRIARYLLGYAGFTPVANVTGMPGISVPIGVSKLNLPMGMQIMGPIGSEARLLQVAAQWERAKPWPLLAPAWQS